MSGQSNTPSLAEGGGAVSIPLEPTPEARSGPDGQVAINVSPGATIECVRCGSRFSARELANLPERTCSNCGYRIFRKVRGHVAKTLKGE